jgi:hypothetical protein
LWQETQGVVVSDPECSSTVGGGFTMLPADEEYRLLMSEKRTEVPSDVPWQAVQSFLPPFRVSLVPALFAM